mmetsp:Transcript_4269/g.9220  ORF Transcript_4269/g.9220 Transcript_4269/m.9220 type:complete len:224 (-) Transcript_4269:655-1326(-)
MEGSRVPGRNNHATVVRVVLDCIDKLRNLVNALTGVVIVHGLVLCTKVTPLKTVNRTKVALLTIGQAKLIKVLARSISIPNVDVLFLKCLGTGVARDKPQQFLSNTTPKDALGSQKRNCVVAKAETHGSSKRREGSGSSTVTAVIAILKHIAYHIKVLIFLMAQSMRCSGDRAGNCRGGCFFRCFTGCRNWACRTRSFSRVVVLLKKQKLVGDALLLLTPLRG